MLHIKSLVNDPSPREYLTIGVSSPALPRASINGLTCRVPLPSESLAVRSRFDHLVGTGPLDRYGNKGVRNRQVKGQVSLLPFFNGEPADLRPRSSNAVRILTEPPVAKIGRTIYYVVDEVPLSWYSFDTTYRYNANAYAGVLFSVHAGDKIALVLMTVNAYISERYRELRNVAPYLSIVADRSLGSVVSSLNSVLRTAFEAAFPRTSDDKYQNAKPYLRPLAEDLSAFVATWQSKIGSIVHAALVHSSATPSRLSRGVPDVGTYSPDLTRLDAAIQPHVKLLWSHTWTDYELSRHSREVIEALNDFDSNAIAYAKDLKEFGSTVRTLLALPRNLKNPKAWASAWLSFQFGDRLQVADTKELLESLRRALVSRSLYTRGRRSMKWTNDGSLLESHSRTSTVYVTNTSYDGLVTGIGSLMKWDVWPTLENTWDLIPLSFLVDWIIPVSDLLEQIDAAVESPYLQTTSQYIGEKYGLRFRLPQSTGYSGDVEITDYRREIHNVCGDVRPFDWAPSLPSFSVVHAVDALALLVQTTKA